MQYQGINLSKELESLYNETEDIKVRRSLVLKDWQNVVNIPILLKETIESMQSP